MSGKFAATVWFLLKQGQIARIEGLDALESDKRVVANGQRLHKGDIVQQEWIGNEKQVLCRLYLVCDTKEELASAINAQRFQCRCGFNAFSRLCPSDL